MIDDDDIANGVLIEVQDEGRFPWSASFHRLKSDALRAKHKHGMETMVVSVDDVLAVCNEAKIHRSRAKKFRWLYKGLRRYVRAKERDGEIL